MRPLSTLGVRPLHSRVNGPDVRSRKMQLSLSTGRVMEGVMGQTQFVLADSRV